MSRYKISFELKNCLSEIDTLREHLERCAESIGLSKKCTFEINLALEELFINIFSYGFTDNTEHWIKIKISHDDGALIIRIEDDGVPFNPIAAEKPDIESPPEERKIGGLGIHLIKEFMDEIAYERIGNHNFLTMKKTIQVTDECVGD
jgi:serine/threonine-protein kinase RsbW